MNHILRLSCIDQPGIVAAVAGALAQNGCNIEESSQFNDVFSGQFFMRTVFSGPAEDFKNTFAAIAQQFSMDWNIYKEGEPVRTLILASKADHCLNDILYRTRSHLLPLDITAVFSNHETNRKLVEENNIRYECTTSGKDVQEKQIEALIEETGTELIVLARYMQVLSEDLAQRYLGRVINIHHSFLPGFKGAKPYHQAWERGVKIIGATAHFVTQDLDEGPIIEQDVVRVTHAQTPGKMQVIGKDIESRVLAGALQSFAERRVFLHGQRTIIL